jgi:hypothetical protein
MLNVSTFADTADIYAIIHFVPHPCQHITVDQSHSSGDTVAKIPEISRQWSHRSPEEKSHRVKSGDRGGHRINASSSCPVPTHVYCTPYLLLVSSSGKPWQLYVRALKKLGEIHSLSA